MSGPETVIPQTDPHASYLAGRAEIDNAVRAVLDGGTYILGAQVSAFEREYAAWIGVDHAIGTGSGTDALQLALKTCGVGPGDIVFTVSHTAVATVAAIELAGATPVLVDIDPVTYTMDPHSLECALRAIASRRKIAGTPKAVIPVHLYGCPADMPAIVDIAGRHELYVIEDCAQSHGATLSGRMTGGWGHLAAFSFYPTKNLGAFGDGGAVVTNDPALAARARALREYGWEERYVSAMAGMNTRLDELQAAVLRVKLRQLTAAIARRRAIANQYDALLADTAVARPHATTDGKHAYHQYVVLTPQRDRFRAFLRRHNISTAIHYPLPVHRQPAYRNRLLTDGSLAATESVCACVVSLPMYPQLADEDVHRVADVVGRWRPET